MKLCDLLTGLGYKLSDISPDTEIETPATDSRLCSDNSLFIAINGTRRSGEDHITEALSNGAAAVVCERRMKNVPCITVPDTRRAAALIWNNYFGNPARDMCLVGITGTNGKTSTSIFLKNILSASGRKTGLIGTLGAFVGEEKLSSSLGEVSDIAAAMTTPDPKYLYGALAKMKERGVNTVVMEVSSHSVLQKRIDALNFSLGIFTNLSPEHLDCHGNTEEYFRIKATFLGGCRKTAVNGDDPFGKRLSGIRYSLSDTERVSLSDKETSYILNYCGRKIEIKTPVCGRFTVYNTLAAAYAALLVGVDDKYITEGIGKTKAIPGRMELIADKEKYGFSVYIDYAHTPTALFEVLSSLKKIKNNGRLIVVFGCGGDRDPKKRPEMGKIAATLADWVVVTSDNPRNERQMSIIDGILQGVPSGYDRITVAPMRRDAICTALEFARENDVILLAGKGHEGYEIIGNQMYDFSERQIVSELLKRKFGK